MHLLYGGERERERERYALFHWRRYPIGENEFNLLLEIEIVIDECLFSYSHQLDFHAVDHSHFKDAARTHRRLLEIRDQSSTPFLLGDKNIIVNEEDRSRRSMCRVVECVQI